MQKERDPLNLGSLPLVTPPADNWPEIKAALLKQSRRRRFARYAGATLAAAATAESRVTDELPCDAPHTDAARTSDDCAGTS